MKKLQNLILRQRQGGAEATKRVLVVLALVIATVTFPLAAWADSFRFRGDSADASFFSTDGCVETNVFVFASDGIFTFHDPPGPPVRSSGSGAFLNIFQHDPCIEMILLDVFCQPPVPFEDQDFQVSRRLESASLNAMLECFDFMGEPAFNVDVNLEWVGIGPLSRSTSNFHFQTPGFIVNGHFTGQSRSADVSGTVSDGYTNFTPDVGFGIIISAKSGEVVID